VTRPIAHAALSALLAFLALAVPFAAWRFYARFPTRIDWTAAARLRLSAVGLSVELDAKDVESISPDPQFLGFFTLRSRGGKKLRLLAQFDDFHELLTRLRAANSNIELRGC